MSITGSRLFIRDFYIKLELCLYSLLRMVNPVKLVDRTDATEVYFGFSY